MLQRRKPPAFLGCGLVDVGVCVNTKYRQSEPGEIKLATSRKQKKKIIRRACGETASQGGFAPSIRPRSTNCVQLKHVSFKKKSTAIVKSMQLHFWKRRCSESFFLMQRQVLYPSVAARTPRKKAAASLPSSYSVCKLCLTFSAGSPRRHWYADCADNDIHCLQSAEIRLAGVTAATQTHGTFIKRRMTCLHRIYNCVRTREPKGRRKTAAERGFFFKSRSHLDPAGPRCGGQFEPLEQRIGW